MSAFLTYDRIEDRRWVEQQLSEDKEKWIDDRAQEIIDALPKSHQVCSSSRYRWTKAHTKVSAAMPPERHITISFR